MRRLGPMLLSALLLGVPRALEARTFGRQRSFYVEVAPGDPELSDFGEELGRALDASHRALVPRRGRNTVVVEIQRLVRSRLATGPIEAVSALVDDGASRQRLVLYYAPDQRSSAAQALLAALPGRLAPAS